ncbi:MAG: M1 family metallopeptidase [Thermoanaerobaculia bacterium]
MRNALRPALVLLLAAGIVGGFGLAQSRPEPRASRQARQELREHEEAHAKRVLSLTRAIQRGSEIPVLPVEGEARGVDVLAYDLSFSLDPAVKYLEGRNAIRISGVAASTSSLAIDFDGAYELVETSRDGRPVTPLTREGSRLVIPLDPPVRREERATLAIAFKGVPPSYSGLQFLDTGSGFVATSQAEPFEARTFWPCVDDPSDRAVTTVHATVPDGYVVASAGLASTVAAPGGRITTTWRLPQPISTYLVSLNVGPYVTLEDTYTALDGVTTMPLISYLLPSHREMNRVRIADFRRQMQVQASLFGEYPYLDSKYGVVESIWSGGMEHPTMTSIGTAQLGNPTRNLTFLFVHELSHQWWGDHVTMRTWDDLFLNEGFATYAEVLFDERANGANPGLVLSTTYDDGLYAGALAHQVVAPVDEPFRFTGSVYRKGAYALHMLRRRVGDEVFFAALRAYGVKHGNGNASRADLRADFEAESGIDLKSFFDQWIETPFRPILRATFQNRADGSARIVLSQRQTHAVVHPQTGSGDVTFYRFPLTIRLRFGDGSTRDEHVEVTERDQTFDFPNTLARPVAGIVLDPNGDVLKSVEATGPA